MDEAIANAAIPFPASPCEPAHTYYAHILDNTAYSWPAEYLKEYQVLCSNEPKLQHTTGFQITATLEWRSWYGSVIEFHAKFLKMDNDLSTMHEAVFDAASTKPTDPHMLDVLQFVEEYLPVDQLLGYATTYANRKPENLKLKTELIQIHYAIYSQKTSFQKTCRRLEYKKSASEDSVRQNNARNFKLYRLESCNKKLQNRLMGSIMGPVLAKQLPDFDDDFDYCRLHTLSRMLKMRVDQTTQQINRSVTNAHNHDPTASATELQTNIDESESDWSTSFNMSEFDE